MAHLSVHTRPCKLAASMPHSLSHRKSSYLSDEFYYWVYPVCIGTLMCFVWSVHMLATAAEQKYSRSCIVSLCSSSRGIFMVGTVHSSYFYLFQGIKIGVCPLSSQKKPHDRNVFVRSYICSGVRVCHLLLYLRHVIYIFFFLLFVSSTYYVAFLFSPVLLFFLFFFFSFKFLSPCMNLSRHHPCKVALIYHWPPFLDDAFAFIVTNMHTHVNTDTTVTLGHVIWMTQHTIGTPPFGGDGHCERACEFYG